MSLSNNAANWVVAGSMVIQTVFFFITFKLGSQYLKQHREKIKEEQKQKLIVDAVKTIVKLRSDCVSYYAIIDDNPFDDTSLGEIESHIGHVIKRHYSFHDLKKSIENSHFELTALSEVLNDSEIRDDVKRVNKLLDLLDRKYKKMSAAAFENDWEGAYEFSQTLEFHRNHGNQNAPINLLISQLSILIDELLKIYWRNE